MISLDQRIFLIIDAPAHPAPALVILADIAASWLVYAVMLLMVGLWVWGAPDRRGALLATAAGAAMALGLNQLLGMLWYEPRPFVIGLGHTLIAHAADNSFPSDHASFIWSTGLGLAATGVARRWAVGVCIGGWLAAWARIFLGVHFPIDMATSLLVALLAAGVARALLPAVKRWALPLVLPIYVGSLQRLHLPSSLFPRDPMAAPALRRGPLL